MIQALGSSLDRWAKRWVPDPFVFAVILTALTGILGIILTGSGPMEMVEYWQTGFWGLLAFAMQMCLILVTGHALATSPAVLKILKRLSELPKTPGAAVMLVAFCATAASLIHWGLGIIAGALLAKNIATHAHKQGRKLPYPLLGAAAYSGFIVWHGGLSGSAPLKVAESQHFLAAQIGVIPISQTLFSPLNIVMAIVMLIAIPLAVRMLLPKDESDFESIDDIAPQFASESEPEKPQPDQPAGKLENSRVLSIFIGGMGLVWLVWHFAKNGPSLDLNTVNCIFLFCGILLQGTPIRYVRAVAQSAGACGGIILQFPFYAGIMGMMKYSGLVGVMANFFVSISNKTTFPVFSFLSAGLVNLFVPSGGGQWAVQGPVLTKAAAELGVSIPKTVMALSYGDAWTNMLQPFWALPLLGITGLKARQIVGYTLIVMIITGALFSAGLLLLPA